MTKETPMINSVAVINASSSIIQKNAALKMTRLQ